MKKGIFLTLLITVTVFSYVMGYSIGLSVKNPGDMAGQTTLGVGAPAKANGQGSADAGGYGGSSSPAPAAGGYGQ